MVLGFEAGVAVARGASDGRTVGVRAGWAVAGSVAAAVGELLTVSVWTAGTVGLSVGPAREAAVGDVTRVGHRVAGGASSVVTPRQPDRRQAQIAADSSLFNANPSVGTPIPRGP